MDESKMNEEYGQDRKWLPFESFTADMKTKGKNLKRSKIVLQSTGSALYFCCCWLGSVSVIEVVN